MHQLGKSTFPTFGPKKKAKRPWNFYRGKWASYFRWKFKQREVSDDTFSEADWHQLQEIDANSWGLGICKCGLARYSTVRCCPMCGRLTRRKMDPISLDPDNLYKNARGEHWIAEHPGSDPKDAPLVAHVGGGGARSS